MCTDIETCGYVISKTTGQVLSAEMQASMPVVFRVSAQDYRMWAFGRELTFSPQYSFVFETIRHNIRSLHHVATMMAVAS